MCLNERIKKVYVPMTETGFYILFSLQKPKHGYGISLLVKSLTGGDVNISPGTMYGTLSKMESDGLIRFHSEEENRKLYVITELGTEVLHIEQERIQRLYQNSREEIV